MKKLDDSIKPGCGIDGSEGENVLRSKKPYEQVEKTRDVMREVEANQPDSGNRAIKSRGQ